MSVEASAPFCGISGKCAVYCANFGAVCGNCGNSVGAVLCECAVCEFGFGVRNVRGASAESKVRLEKRVLNFIYRTARRVKSSADFACGGVVGEYAIIEIGVKPAKIGGSLSSNKVNFAVFSVLLPY